MFPDLERFVTAHRACGELAGDVGELAEAGYEVRLTCSCGAAFKRWVAPDVAGDDLLRSSLLAFPKAHPIFLDISVANAEMTDNQGGRDESEGPQGEVRQQ